MTAIKDNDELQERISALTDFNPNPIIELNASLAVIYTNLAAQMKFPDLAVHTKTHPILEDLRPEISELLDGKSEYIVYERETVVDQFVYEVQIFVITKTKHVYLFITDVTKRKQAEQAKKETEEQLFQSQKMEALGKLTGGIAHDFNNILTVIKLNLQLLQNQAQKDSKEMIKISAALEATQRAEILSKRLLSFSRHADLEPKLLNIQEFISNIESLIRPAIGSGINLNIQINSPVGKVYVDANQLESSILNLAFNARDAMSGKGNLDIMVSNLVVTEQDFGINQNLSPGLSPGEYVKISLRDTGQGVSKENLSRMFEPFFTTKEEGKGTGLGLSQVYGFVTQSKGCITIDTEVNKGTCINLFFPRV